MQRKGKNVREKKLSHRIQRFKDAGLLGCFDDSGVTSENYNEFLCASEKYWDSEKIDTRFYKKDFEPSKKWLEFKESLLSHVPFGCYTEDQSKFEEAYKQMIITGIGFIE